MSLMYIIFAVLGLSFLIFIHELGHYFMAKRVGMRVETFSIGMGRAIVSWMHGNEKWQIGWLPFGGYVRIAGMDTEEDKDPYAVKDGYFGKSPWDRIKVAFMGPLVNIIFALLVFALIWVGGGRVKNFSEYTPKIGWVDKASDLYREGVRPGDEITNYDGREYEGAKDHLYAPLTASDTLHVTGSRIDYKTGQKTPFQLDLKPYAHPNSVEKGIATIGVMIPASYLIYDKLPDGSENPLADGSPLKDSGIQYGDRIIWADGEMLFSIQQLNSVLNDKRALVTVQRGDQTFLARVPRVLANEFRLDSFLREELTDWQYEAGLNQIKFDKLYAIPYNLDNEGVVEGSLRFVDKDKENEVFPEVYFSELEKPLLPGDRIIAVEGMPVKKSYEILDKLQNRVVQVIVQRDPSLKQVMPWNVSNKSFDDLVDEKDLQKIADSIGTAKVVAASGDLVLLKPIQPKTQSEIFTSPEKKAQLAAESLEIRKQVESIEDPAQRQKILTMLKDRESQLFIGLPSVQDRKVSYNPVPTDQFMNVFSEIKRTLGALVTGNLNPKWISGPIGIVQVVQSQWKLSFAEALYWLGAISLNLGILNLLPIPMLDGGHILMSLAEIVTKKRIPPKTLEKVIMPFAVLLIIFFIFLTFNDILRIYKSF